MKTKILSIAILSVLFFLSGCTERIDIELDSSYARCVIYGEITTDTTQHKVTVRRTGDYYGEYAPIGISGANVSISDGDNVFELSEDPENPGVYLTQDDVYGIPGRIYTLNVSNVDLLDDGIMQSYEATSELRQVAEPDSIDVLYRREWEGWIIQAYATDPAETEDFYMFHTYINGVLQSDSLMNINIQDDLFFNGNQTNGALIEYIPGEDGLAVNDTVTIGFCGITQDYYVYLIETQVSARPSNPLFSGAPANPKSNISNNAIGFFTAYSIERATKIVKQVEYYQ
ncbi:MAG TPA: DUF4249 family protein [Tenuifilaceae bacterium]|nr:DUF4249 family protein [Tenuifilaceae bacterium]HPE18080.1 DUF4249 family protein [Tenuifilaceae bacterium]HPJ45450.1 DUF4249 family protein [Tenuifilaceae bacterium]HPQ34067.1 DUF4249 family protein [Tenuifilaceae bacterium]HRX68038.1 DUF4249 family protein [Tenuifilaceae bacterium]